VYREVPVRSVLAALPLIASGASLVLAYHASRRRTRASLSLTAFLAGLSVWCLGAGLEPLATDGTVALRLTSLAYLGVVSVPPALLAAALQATGYGAWVTGRNVLLVALVPCATWLLVLTNVAHGLVWSEVSFGVGAVPGLSVRYGPWFWVHCAFSYVCMAVATALLLRRYLAAWDESRGRALAVVVGISVPWLANAAYVFGIGPAVDLTPPAFAVSAAALGWLVLRERGLELIPVARSTVIDAMGDSVLVVDRQGGLVDANPAAQDLLGLPAHWQVGEPLARALSGHPAILEALTGSGVGPRQVVVSDEPGKRFLELHPSTLRDGQGRITGSVAVISDITDQVEREQARRELEVRMQAAQKLESLGVLAGGIAHDFNNLLTGVLGNTSLALAELPAESSSREVLKEVERAALRAADLCTQMLVYSGHGSFEPEAVELSQLAREMASLLRASISKTAELRLELAPELPSVEGDPTQLRQIAMNLIMNASEALPEHGGVIVVRTGVGHVDAQTLSRGFPQRTLPEGRYLHLEVSDTGSGMDESTQRKLFEPFFTTKFAGRGLGMAAVLGIVKRHGGTVLVATRPGAGSTLRVLLPVARGYTASAARRAALPLEPPPARVEPGTILVVDDEEQVRKVLCHALRRRGHRTLAAGCGREGLARLREHGSEIQAVVLDLTMPDLRGDQVLERIRADEPKLPVILVSGYAEQEVGSLLLGQEPATFLRKPFTAEELDQALQHLLTLPAGA
jgi:PAS domain S-box-containing protein